MKIIVVSGAESGIGKTTLVEELKLLLGDKCVAVKIGHGESHPDKNRYFYHTGVEIGEILNSIPQKKYIIIESNSILKQIHPDLVLYIDSINRKKSAELAFSMAHIRSGEMISPSVIEAISQKTELPESIIKRIVWLTGARCEKVLGVLLAGGKNSRMGKEKALLKIGDKTIAQKTIDTIKPLCDSVVISIQKGRHPPLDGYPVVHDISPDMGPLMGMHSALSSSTSGISIITPCDVPYINQGLIKKMLSFTDNYDIIVPSFHSGVIESLLGIYKKVCCDAMNVLLEKKQLRISELFKLCKTKIISGEDGAWYANLNTPQEYDTYCKGLPE